jgi:hypothetical protein
VTAPEPEDCDALLECDPGRSDLADFARAQGYLLLRGAAPPEAVARLCREVVALCARRGWVVSSSDPVRARPGATLAGNGWDDPRFLDLQRDLFEKDAFRALGRTPAVRDALAQIYGGPARGGRGEVCRVVLPDSPRHTTGPHQESFYLDRGAELWVAWIPLVPCPPELGALALAPGTHHQGLLPHAGEHGEGGIRTSTGVRWATTTFEPGDVLLFHGLTAHRALHNTTGDRVRLSCDYRFVPEAG